MTTKNKQTTTQQNGRRLKKQITKRMVSCLFSCFFSAVVVFFACFFLLSCLICGLLFFVLVGRGTSRFVCWRVVFFFWFFFFFFFFWGGGGVISLPCFVWGCVVLLVDWFGWGGGGELSSVGCYESFIDSLSRWEFR